MFKISDFSRFTRISVKMLRHYDDIGLLRPAAVDPQSGYRYYAAAQLPRLNRIIALKDLGFSLDEIASLLDSDLPLSELRGMLRLRRSEIVRRLQAEQRRLLQVDERLRQLDEEERPPEYDIVLRAVPAQLVAALRTTISDLELIAPMFDEVEAFAAAYAARSVGCPLLIMYDSEEFEEERDLEVAVPLNRPLPSGERVLVRELAAVPQMACVVYTGSYERGDAALRALMRWVDSHGLQIAGPIREVYLQFSANNVAELDLPQAFLVDRAADYVTEIQVPVE